jgi:hypothetical protein
LFGVSIYCQNGTVARDSIAMATSGPSGNSWAFVDYVIEPDARTCTLPISEWPRSMVYQVNDPDALQDNDSNVLLVLYTSVLVPADGEDPNREQCGSLGMVNLTLLDDRGFKVAYRNDQYLIPSKPLGQCAAPYDGRHAGFSRPSWLCVGSGDTDRDTSPCHSTQVWFDSAGAVGRIDVTSLTSLNNSAVQWAGISALDVFPRWLSTHHGFGNDQFMLLYNSPDGIMASGLQDNQNTSSWGEEWLFSKMTRGNATNTTTSGTTACGQGSPTVFFDPAKCELRLIVGELRCRTDTDGVTSVNSRGPLQTIALRAGVARNRSQIDFLCYPPGGSQSNSEIGDLRAAQTSAVGLRKH